MKIRWQINPGVEQAQGHDYGIFKVAVTPDGKTIASISAQDRALLIWDAETLRPIHEDYGGTYEKIRGLGISPDGRNLILSYESRVYVIDLQTKQRRNVSALDMESIAFTPDGRSMLVGGEGLMLCALGETLDPIWLLKDRWVSALAVSPDGRRAITAGAVGEFGKPMPDVFRVWDLAAAQEISAFPDSALTDKLVFSPDGRRLLACGRRYTTIRVYDPETGTQLDEIESGHYDNVNCMAFTPDGRRLITGSEDGSLFIRDGGSFEVLRACAGHVYGVTSVAVTADGRRLISGSYDCTVRRWDVETGALLGRSLPGKAHYPVAAITPDGQYVVGTHGRDDCVVAAWDIRTGDMAHRFEGHTGRVNAIDLVPGTSTLLTASADHTVRLWDWRSGRPVRTLAGHSGQVRGVRALRDGRRAVSIAQDGRVKTWDIASGQQSGADIQFEVPRSVIGIPITLAAGGRCLATDIGDGRTGTSTAMIWDMESQDLLKTLLVYAVAITPDSRRAIFAYGGNQLLVWDLETGQERHKLTVHDPTSGGMLISIGANDQMVAAWSTHRKTIEGWDLDTGRSVFVCGDHPDRAVLLIDPDGRYVVSATSELVRLWEIPGGRLIASEKIDTNESSRLLAASGGQAFILSGDNGCLACFEL